ncbi:MAG: hypothetical protein IPI95_12560 [Flavobacteriales bacterium]|nr:hypothetical protein [Flavobacteriales bacterium]
MAIMEFPHVSYSGMQYAMFLVMRDIRGLAVDALSQKLHDLLTKESENFTSNDRLRVHQQNRYYIHRLLARITDFVETSSGQPSRYLDYVSEGKTRCEVEHIWADHAERHTDEFDHPADFAESATGSGPFSCRRVSTRVTESTYIEKLPHYNTQNLLARSLHPQCYQHNPGFIRFKSESEIPFAPMPAFKKTELEARGDLYRQLAEKIWDPAHLLQGCQHEQHHPQPLPPAYKPAGVPWLQQVPEHWELLRTKNFLREVNVRSKTGKEDLLSVSLPTGITAQGFNARWLGFGDYREDIGRLQAC